MLLQRIIVDQLEKISGQSFLHKLATDKEYFKEVSRYLEENHKMSLEEFVISVYRSSGGDVNFRDYKDEAALYSASENDNQDMVRILTSCGISIDDFNCEISNRIQEKSEQSRRISLSNNANVSHIYEIIRRITNIRDAFQHLDLRHSDKRPFIVGCTSFVSLMAINAIKGNYYNGPGSLTCIPVFHANMSNFSDFTTDRINTFASFIIGTIAYKTAQNISTLVRDVSSLLHNRLEVQKNESEIARYKKIQENVISILSEVKVGSNLSRDINC